MYRTFVILRYTFLEAVLQPIYALLLTLGGGILIVFSLLPFFTLGDDTRMFMSVGLDVILLLVLLSTLFATSKSIFDEIEDRTMLTLMSKPVSRWEVMVGKYLGIILAAGLGVAILGAILCFCTWFRIPGDYLLQANSLNDQVQHEIWGYRKMHIAGLMAQLTLTWLQISVLAAVGVALSTRVSLVVNLPAVIILYLAGNLSRFLFPLATGPLKDYSNPVKGIAWLVSLILPYLNTFDMRELTVLATIKVSNTQFANDSRGISVSAIWTYVAIAALYAFTYSVFALCAGMWSFQTKELGGGEG